jgi:lycopene cyclase domain-containing protein
LIHLQNHFTYFIILAASIAGPLALSFDKKVAFYKKWKYVFKAMLLPALFYIAWDSYFTYKGIWSFNAEYNIGFYLYNLPIEEILFFIIVPYCCLFIYECIRCYFPNLKNNSLADLILLSMAIVFLILGILFKQQQYTSWTFILNFIFITVLYLVRKHFKSFDALSFLVSYLICLIPFLLVNGFLTALPVIKYNHAENFNLRIYTIPVEDIFYGMLLILLNVVIYEKLKTASAK